MGPELAVTHYSNPVTITFGPGSPDELAGIFRSLGARRVTLITEGSILQALGIRERVQALLADRDLSIYEGVQPNPQVGQAQAAVEFARAHGAEAVLGIGGGSALDTAKVVAACLPNDGEVLPLLKGRRALESPSLPTVMVPTTAGTGSEVTRWATLWDLPAKRKHSLEGPGMYPAHAVLDPELTRTVPPYVTATTGMDALSHALEAYWNRHANPVSDLYALAAVERTVEALPLVMAEPGNREYRTGMLLASLLAGLAFSNTKTAAAHSLSYPMTLHFGVAHGQASSITLPALLRYNAVAAPVRMLRLARALGGDSIEGGAHCIEALLERVGLKRRLRDLGIGFDEIELCVREGYTPDRAGNNLRELDADGLREVLRMVA